jgi:signal transduction histidine kinase
VTLGHRLMLTLIGITLILIGPAIYGLFALRELHQVAYNLSTRDAVGALVLGRLQTAFREVDNAQRIYLALATQPDDRSSAAERVMDASATVEAELERLATAGYQAATRDAQRIWRELEAAITEEQRLVQAGQIAQADRHREEVVDPAFLLMDRSLDPIGEAINRESEVQVQQAQTIAARAATTTLLALSLALLTALLIGAWTGQYLLRPVTELRRGMARVAEGEFDETLAIDPNRPDEIGDLVRSFDVMAHDLAALDRMKAEFVSVASHELKTPLSVIRGYVSLLRDDVYGEVTAEQKKILVAVGDQTDRLGRLIQQLLDISRFEAGSGRLDLGPIQLPAFLQELQVSFEALAVQNEIDFDCVLEEDLPETIEGDADRLNEVVGNLLSNAFKFTPRGGQITLRAGPAVGQEESVRIAVEDTGVGIPPDQLSRVFEKFYQVENESHPKSLGSGLGLAIAKEIVEAHGGTIGAESSPGERTTFEVFLPLRASSPGAVTSHEAMPA